ncbi:MFS transporter [Streptomyces sp. NPDC048577]|uniref:MFS transporter n=1 Tax=Streptomyces sp. NPDC048577 TaxID=3157209 RepID=UPI00342FC69F
MTYRAVLGTRHVARLLAGTLTGRMPSGMVAVALVLWVTGNGGALATASTLAAVYGLTASITQPVKGRLMDRHGQTRVSAPAAVIASGSLFALPAIGPDGATWAVGAAVALAGIANPPLESGLRSLWPSVVTDPGQRRVIQALDTGSQGLMYVAGPLLATWLAAAFGADVALFAAGGFSLFGTAVVLTSTPSRAWRPDRDDDTAGGVGRGGPRPLLGAGLVLLCAGLAGIGVALGGLAVWAAGVAEAHATGWLTGVLPAAFSTGSFLGGLLFARLPRRAASGTQLAVTASLFAAGWLGLLAQPGPHVAIVAAALPGLFLTMVITSGFETVDTLAPASRATEAYAWLILAVGTGQATGTALAGRFAGDLLILSALPAAGAGAAFAVFVLARPVLGPRRRLGRHRRTSTPSSPSHPLTEGETFMPVKTSWTVIHSCGHEVTHNLADRAADRRAGFARWLEARDCSACWKAAREADTAAKEQWLAARRAEEQAAATEWAEQFGMPPLEGPERALAWGERSRFQLVTAAYTALVTEGSWAEEDWAVLEEKVRTIGRAGWWIDQREADANDLPELLTAATSDDVGTENPHR